MRDKVEWCGIQAVEKICLDRIHVFRRQDVWSTNNHSRTETDHRKSILDFLFQIRHYPASMQTMIQQECVSTGNIHERGVTNDIFNFLRSHQLSIDFFYLCQSSKCIFVHVAPFFSI